MHCYASAKPFHRKGLMTFRLGFLHPVLIDAQATDPWNRNGAACDIAVGTVKSLWTKRIPARDPKAVSSTTTRDNKNEPLVDHTVLEKEDMSGSKKEPQT